LTGVLDEIALAEDINELSLVQLELENQGLIVNKQAVKKGKKENQAYCRIYDVLGFIVRVGRNNTENDKVTFTAKGSDIWLHAKDYHSSHLIIESQKRQVPQSVVIKSAQICAYYSKGREGGKTEIVYMQKKNVKKPSKSKPGFVTYENFKSVTVTPDKNAQFLK
jgi:predicted ribosome quality control (RQC) complex YloA/Tae2 family protein